MDRPTDEHAVRDRVDLSRIEVGDTRPEEVAEAIAVAARAMSTSPMAIAVLGPDQERRRHHLHRFFTRLYKLAANQRPLVARLDGRVVASTNDLVGGACRAGSVDKLRSLPALAITGPRSAIRAAKWFEDWEHRDPDRPHAHYGPFGVEPELQGQGIGSLVMRHYTQRLDDGGEASYLETEKPQNVALYQRFGFEIIEAAEVLGVPNWFMWREPGAKGPALRDR
jgi:GNAT superfamily N-acetyltransferase